MSNRPEAAAGNGNGKGLGEMLKAIDPNAQDIPEVSQEVRALRAKDPTITTMVSSLIKKGYDRDQYMMTIFGEDVLSRLRRPVPVQHSTDLNELNWQLQDACTVSDMYRFERSAVPLEQWPLVDAGIEAEEANIRMIRGWVRLLRSGKSLMKDGQ